MNPNNKMHFIENANKILFELVTKLKDCEIDVKVSGNYEYSEDCTSLDFVEKIDELDFSKHDRKFTDRIKKLEEEIYKKQDEIDKLSKKNLINKYNQWPAAKCSVQAQAEIYALKKLSRTAALTGSR